MDAAAIHARLKDHLGDKIVAFQAEALQPWAVVASDAIDAVAAFAKSDPALAFDNLMCLSAVDYPKDEPPRMETVYHLFSYEPRHQFVLKVHLPKSEGAKQRAVEVKIG